MPTDDEPDELTPVVLDALSLDQIDSMGIKNLREVVSYGIAQDEFETRHIIRFTGGGRFVLRYSREGRLIGYEPPEGVRFERVGNEFFVSSARQG